MDSSKVVINAVRSNLPDSWLNGNMLVHWPNSNGYPSASWLQGFWKYQQSNRIEYDELANIPLIPLVVGNKRYLHRLCEKPLLMTGSNRGWLFSRISLSPVMKQFLEKCGIMFVDESLLDSHICNDLSYQGKLLLPNADGVVTAIVNASDEKGQGHICNMTTQSSEELRKELLQSVENCSASVPDLIYKLNLFKVHGGIDYVSINSCKIVDTADIPSVWNSKFADIVVKQSISKPLHQKLRFVSWSFQNIVECVLKNQSSLSASQKDSFFYFVVESIGGKEMSDSFIHYLQQHICVTSQGIFQKPCHLFEENVYFKTLFTGEKDRFPDSKFNVHALKKLGLKCKIGDVSFQDISTSIIAIPGLNSSVAPAALLLKIESILKTCHQQGFDLSKFSEVKWIPIQTKRVSTYPRSLKWYGQTNSGNGEKLLLDFLKNVHLPSQVDLVGSVVSIVHQSMADLILKLNPIGNPSIKAVVEHLRNLINSYNDDEKGLYKALVYSIYKYLATCDVASVVKVFEMFSIKMWQGETFVDHKRILLKSTTCDIRPYYYQLPIEIPSEFRKILEGLGCGSRDEINLYIELLQEIKDTKHQSFEALKLCTEVVRFLADNIDHIADHKRSSICIPVESNILKLCEVKDCSYHDFDENVSYSSISSYNILHKAFSKDIADKLGIPDLVSQVLEDDDTSFFESWGQHEPLTLRLNRLLKDYEDGLAIPKELIQNADDARATEVSFLYDERENEDLKSYLFDRGMKEWQGPALWSYNNATFQENDFKNITKLNAGTKELDTTKIGKFGLGFNAIYNLTDVPSFLSGESMVIFDPHAKYLGKALKNVNQPGIRIRLKKSKTDYANFQDQFQVFNEIFGACLDFSKGNVKQFDGTLFRFPLRRGKHALESEIKNIEYTDYEMQLLLKKLEDSLHCLLLFTEHVKIVKVFHLSKNAASPKDIEELFSVEKVKIDVKSSSSRSIMETANKVLLRASSDPYFVVPEEKVIEKVNINVLNKTVKNNWKYLVSSCIGGQMSYNFSKNKPGLNPCGGIAVEYMEDLNRSIKPSDNRRSYQMFCFLPLPEKSHLPVHVNGTFEVSNDRKHLTQSTGDEKRYGSVPNWNDLLGKDIGNAYFDMLIEMRQMCPDMEMSDWIKLFPDAPLPDNKSYISELVKSLIAKVITTDECLFPVSSKTGVNWISWKNIVILSQEFPEGLVNSAVEYMNWFHQMEKINKVCMDMPKKLIVLMKEIGYGEQVQNSVLDKKTFFKHFFKHVDNSNIETTLRNQIIKYALHLQTNATHLQECLQTRPCIPTQPRGTLKCPSQLVRLGSKTASLFDVEDEVFPLVEFNDYLTYLENLGMNTFRLSWEKILDRAMSVEIVSSCKGTKNGISRSKKLLPFIQESMNDCPPETKLQLLKIPFLSVCQQPPNCIGNWYGTSCLFSSPSNMYAWKYSNIACCTCLILDEAHSDSLEDFLTVSRVPSFDVVKNQLTNLIIAYESGIKIEQNVIDMLHDIYRYLDNSECFIEEISSMKLLYTENGRLVNSNQVFINVVVELPGHVYKLPSALRRYLSLMKKLGVQEDCLVQNYVTALKSIKEDSLDEPIPSDLLHPILNNIVPHLHENISKVSGQVLFLPDNTNVLRNAREMCFKDIYWVPDEEDMIYAHEHIPPAVCKQLGVKEKQSHFIAKKITGIPFGQYENLTTQIKNLLRGYSEEEDVLKEIIQNADDAGATEVEVILDMRTHKDERVISDKWKPLQGPALLVSNNGIFTEKDLEAIQKLGKGNKSKDALKTGRYGVGFNAVYRITDCPSFLTSIDGKDDVLCVFDPNLLYAEGATKEHPGYRLNHARALLQNTYTDIKSAFLIEEFNSAEKTLFRFPLRNAEMASNSEIRDKVTNPDNVETFIRKLKEDAPAILLFLNNVKQLSFTVFKNGGRVQKDSFAAKPYEISDKKLKDFKAFQNNLQTKLGNVAVVMKSKRSVSYNICVQYCKGDQMFKSYHWNIVEQCGFSDMTELDETILNVINTNELCLIPKGAVAFLTAEKVCEKCETSSHERKSDMNHNIIGVNKVFCGLPVPIKSGLPLLINGHFVLDYETRRDLWTNENKTVERLWNYAILKNCVLPCYISHVNTNAEALSGLVDEKEKEKTDRKLRKYYELFPRKAKKEQVSDYWNFFGVAFYEHVCKSNLALLAVFRVHENELKFCKPVDFLLHKSARKWFERSPLLKVLQCLYIDTDLVPENVAKNFKECDAPLLECSPTIIRHKLIEVNKHILPRSGQKWKVADTVFKTIENVIMVLRYCLKDDEKTEDGQDNSQVENLESGGEDKKQQVTRAVIDGLPLCVLADETMIEFSTENKTFFSDFSNILKGKENMFLHRKVLESLKATGNKCEDHSCFQEFSLDQFTLLLPDVLSAENYYNAERPIHLTDSNSITEDWLQLFWKYISSLQLSEDSMDLEEIGNWSLLLVKHLEEKYLLSICQSKAVLFLSDVTRAGVMDLVPILREIFLVFEVLNETSTLDGVRKDLYPKGILRKIFGSIDNFKDLIDAIEFSYTHCSPSAVSPTDAETLLQHLSQITKEISSDYKDKLRTLPLYERMNGNVQNAIGDVIVLSMFNVPENGIEVLEQQYNCIFLKEKIGFVEEVHQILGFQFCDFYSFYTNYFFPAMDLFDEPSNIINDHMLYIRDSLYEQTFRDKKGEEKVTDFMSTLSHTKFILTNDGSKKSCNQLYDPRKEIFKVMMLDETCFPPDNYQECEWLTFLRKIGLVTTLGQDLFIDFAHRVEDEECEKKALKASILLCEELRSNEALTEKGFLSKVKQIAFLLPDQSRTREAIHTSLNSTKKRICFENSSVPHHRNLLWTTMTIVPSYADECFKKLSKKEELYDDLSLKVNVVPNKGFPESTINSSKVLEHIRNITSGNNMVMLSETCKDIEENQRKTIVTVLKAFYNYSVRSKCFELKENVESMKAVSYILVNEHSNLEEPWKSVLSLENIIPPYLNAIDVNLGEYFELFKSIGCTQKPTIIQYVNVLKELKNMVKDEVLTANEMIYVTKAVCYMSKALETYGPSSFGNGPLYLPTGTFGSNQVYLTLSTEAIVIDDYHMEKRLQNFHKQLVLSSYDTKEGGNVTTIDMLIEYLPQEMRPQILSHIVDEALSSSMEPQNVGKDHISVSVKARLQSPLFLNGVERLLKHEQKYSSQSNSVATNLSSIINALKKVKVFVLGDVKTLFKHEGIVIEGSEATKHLYLRNHEDCLEIYFYVSLQPYLKIYTEIADGLLNLFKNPLKHFSTILILPLLLSHPLQGISSLLDEMGIRRDESDPSFLDCGQIPEPGDLVPLELYPLLRNNFVDFKLEEFVALERGSGNEQLFVYAIIRRCDNNFNTSQRVYGVQASSDEDMVIEIKAFDLYRFDRHYHNQNELVTTDSLYQESPEDNGDFEEIQKRIKEQLEELIGLPVEDRKKIIRRLYFKWHPDKHPEETKPLATQVFQFLQNELRKMNLDYESNFDDWNSRAHRESRSYYDWFRNFNSFFRGYRAGGCGHGRSGRAEGGEYRRRTSHHFCPPTFQGNNPQPSEARRWLRQAQSDMSSAVGEKSNSYEWICFKAHQAAEKALKAAQYRRHYTKTKSDNLITNAVGLSSELNDLACQLENLLISSTHMRYPDRWDRPVIPHYHYDKEKVEKAISIARRILELVDIQVNAPM